MLQPVRCKVKMRRHMKHELQVPGLLVDAMVKDAAVTFTREQYLAIVMFQDTLTKINLAR